MKKYTFIRSNGRLERLVFDNIVYIEAKGNYSSVAMTNGRRLMASINLSGWLLRLPLSSFCRISRGFIISLDHIEHIGKDTVQMKNARLQMSDHYRKDLVERLMIIDEKKEPIKKSLHAA